MKVLQLGKSYPPIKGGIETAILNITEGLNACNIRCDVLGSNDENTYHEQTIGQYKIYRTKSLGKIFSLSISPQLINKYLRIKDNYDIVHVHFPDPLAVAAVFLARPKGIVVVHWHSDIIRQRHLAKPLQFLINWLLNRADAIIASSEAYVRTSEYLRGFFNKTVIIPYGIRTSELTVNEDTVAAIRHLYKGKIIIYSLGRLVYYKGFDHLIEAARSLSNDYAVVIGGDGPLLNRLRKSIDINRLADKVFLHGHINNTDMGSYYEACDIFCLPSTERSEAFGIALVEAMSFGKPLVTTNIPTGVSWVNQDGLTGLVVNPGNAGQLAEAIQTISTDERLYHFFSGNCRKRYQSFFSQDKMIDTIVSLYVELLARQ
ncbi:glycosyltransferase [Candidatus Magnetominusculus dajiuhuensis]|uniref:glycosyltransferase n=1 Tax=Candidatus Magnetominusculus dajiuhuensis TaxID=3137712 RepID=UPI003B433D33